MILLHIYTDNKTKPELQLMSKHFLNTEGHIQSIS